ncbi:MAG: metallophosphoesterase [Pseudohongiellaceae bacterium]
MKPFIKNSLLGFLLVFISFVVQLATAEDHWHGVARIVAVGDIHGDYENFVKVLTAAGLIDRRGIWAADDTHFVQLGDLPDRGPDTDEIIEHMKNLERQARRGGGMVHALIGNHEAMNMLGDLRYVHADEYEALRSRRARTLRDNLYKRLVARLLVANPEFVTDAAHREEFDSLYPLGFVEHRMAWSVDGEFGSWVRAHNAVIKINRSLFLHGGISPEVLGTSISEINDRIRSDLGGTLEEVLGLSETQSGPLWYRGLANNDEAMEQAHVEAVLAFYDVDRIVVGHTPGLGTIVPRFGGKVLVIDTGISAYYGGHMASLLIEGDKLIALQNGVARPVPLGEEPLLPYFRSIAEQESIPAALQNLIESLSIAPQLSN